MNEDWDAGFTSGPVVLIHYFKGNHSYLVPDTKGKHDSTKGSIFGIEGIEAIWDSTAFYHFEIPLKDIDGKERIVGLPIKYRPTRPSLRIEGLDIDVNKRIARISIKKRVGSNPLEVRHTFPEGWKFTWLPGGIPSTSMPPTKDIEIVNEKIIRTPQWSLRPILKSLADISSSERFNKCHRWLFFKSCRKLHHWSM